MSVSLKVNFLGRELAGPVIAASGTFGYGEEYAFRPWAGCAARG